MGRDDDPPDLAARILGLLPGDGTPVLNRVMRAMLARACERPIDQETYFAARDRLLAEGRIGRLRGQGGQVFLNVAEAPPAEAPVPEADARWLEARLMAPLQTYLEGTFRKGLDLGDNLCLIQDTSTLGPRQGQWARPDFILVSAMRFRLLPGARWMSTPSS